MDKVVQEIKKVFDKEEWKYKYEEEENIFVSGVNMLSAIGNVDILISVDDDFYIVYTVINSKVEKTCVNAVSEFINRANSGLKNGNFEMDYSDGEIRYKVFSYMNDESVSEEVVTNSMILGVLMIKKYGEGLLKIMLGMKEPEETIREIEDQETMNFLVGE